MKQFLTFLLFVLCFGQTTFVCAQNIEWSPPLRQHGKSSYLRILGANSTGYYILRSRQSDFSRDVFLERYKAALGLDYVKEIPKANRTRFENMILYEGGLLIFRSFDNTTTNKIELFANRVDEMGIINNNTWVKIDESPKKFSSDKGDFTIVPSSDKALIACSHSEKGDKDQSVLAIAVINKQLTQQSVKKLNTGHPFDLVSYNELQIDNNNNIFFSATLTHEEKKKSSFERQEHVMYAWYRHLDTLTTYQLGDKGKYIHDFSFGVNYVKKCLTICGVFSNTNYESTSGTFLYNISLDSGVVLYSNFQDFERSTIAKFVGEREATRSPELANMQMKRLVMRSDGGMVIAVENVYTTQQTYTYYVNGMPQYSYRNIYNYDDILIVSVDQNGKQEWNNQIRKKQATMNDQGYFSSFQALPYQDKIHFIFNDNSRSNGDVVDVSINNKGEMEKNILMNAKTTFAIIVPSESKLISYNTILMAAIKDKSSCLVKITF